jgi:hypothetical protein
VGVRQSDALPQTIGRYEVLGRLGTGATGLVFLAMDPLIRRRVAIKTLHVTRSLSPEQWQVVHERFLREAQTAGNIDHPNIVKIYDMGREESGELYIVMECVEGESLDRILDRERKTPEEVVALLAQVAAAFDVAHACGIVHRDVKPGNLMVTPDGVVKVTDFGIARIASSHLTQDLRELGTPRYMSPEQVQGLELSGRADLFALGVIAYQLLCGRVPFEGDSHFTLAYQIVHAHPPAASSLAPELPPAVDHVLERMLHKDPARRFATGKEFVEGLRATLAPAAAPAPERTPPRAALPALLVLAGTLALAVSVAFLRDPPVASSSAAVVPQDPVPTAPEPPPRAAPATVSALAQVNFTHWTREGRLTLLIDGKPAMTRRFVRGKAPMASHAWAVSVPAGTRRVGARVLGAKGKVYEAAPIAVVFSPDSTRELRLKLGRELSLR